MPFIISALRSEELNFELISRNIDPVPATVLEKRKLLSDLIQAEKVSPPPTFDISKLDVEAQIKTMEARFAELATLIEDYLQSPSVPFLYRLLTRLTHYGSRLDIFKRASVTDPRLVTLEALHSSLLIRCTSAPSEGVDENLQVEAAPAEMVRASVSHIEAEVIDAVRQMRSSSVNVPSPNFSSVQKPVPVRQWGLTFTATLTDLSVVGFLQRVDELKRARHISDEELFDSAIDLFDGQGLLWFRSVRGLVNSWEELVERLKRDFLPLEYDEELLDTIRSRKQGDNERPVAFFAAMENLFARLQQPLSAKDKLKFLQKNLHPSFATQLALVEVTTAEQLGDLCRKIEAMRMRNLKFRNPAAVGPIEPDLACVSTPVPIAKSSVSKSVVPKPTVSSLCRSPASPRRGHGPAPSPRCFNCHEPSHTFHTCEMPMKHFCFKCGTPDVTYPTCLTCHPKNGDMGPSGSTVPGPEKSKRIC